MFNLNLNLIQCTLESVPTKPKEPRWATRATYAKDRTKIYSAAGPSKWLWVAAVRTLLVPGPANCGLTHIYSRNRLLDLPPPKPTPHLVRVVPYEIRVVLHETVVPHVV